MHHAFHNYVNMRIYICIPDLLCLILVHHSLTNHLRRFAYCFIFHAAAKINGNEMLKTYHRGAYGSKKLEEWIRSCCGYCGKNQEGCFSVSDDSMVHPRRPTHKRSHTDELSKMLSQANTKPGLRLIYNMHSWHRSLKYSLYHLVSIGNHILQTTPVQYSNQECMGHSW